MFVAERFRVLLIVGDDLNDFVSGAMRVSPEERRQVAVRYAQCWGTKWIVLPNPVYGSWETRLAKPGQEQNVVTISE
ncbi:MAG: hypothetical protein JXD19_01350 [Deltaproteobacteria bacterium]|nr:hypothetical protein [Deltaproteobacteria bacterium]